jgi:hypothetical protein
MAIVYRVLGQSAPSATTNTDIYVAPSGTSAVCSTLAICNRSVATTYRVAVRPAGATLANQHYVVYDAYANGNETTFLTLGIALATTDVVTVYAGSANLSFSLFGSEIA